MPPGRLVEQAHDVDHRVIIDRDDQIGILDIVDPGHVLVADAFDAVRAKAVLQQGGALQRFAGDNLAARENLLEVIAAGNGAGRTGGKRHAAVGIIGAKHRLQHFFHGMPGDFIVPQIIAKLLELVEDHQILAGLAQLPAFIENFFYVQFAARGGDHLAGNFGKPLKALLAHAFGQDGDRLAAQQGRVIRAAAAVIAGRRPDGFLRGRVELPGHQARDQAAERRADFMRAGGEPFAHQGDHPRRGPGQAGGQFNVVHSAEAAAGGHRLIFPGDAEQVQRGDIPQPHILERRANLGRHAAWGLSSAQRLG